MDTMEEEYAKEDSATSTESENLLLSRKCIIPRSKQTIVMQAEDGSTIFSCTECSTRCNTTMEMEIHLTTHNDSYRFLCTICGSGFKRKVHLDRHLAEHQSVRPYECMQCGRAFKRKEHLTIHSTKMHKNGSCDNFSRQVDMSGRQAIITQKDDDTTVFTCMECAMHFGVKEEMELHLLMHNKEYRFLCTICGKALKRKEHLERHMQEHQEYRPYVCDECGKGFKRKEHLTIHRNIHSDQRNQVCHVCSKSFHRKDHLQKHMETHNRHFLKQAFSDVKEEVGFPVISNVGNPMELISMMNPATTAPDKRHVCEVCDKAFKRKDRLKEHMRTHDRKCVCSECGQVFSTEEQLLGHMNTHLVRTSLLESECEQTMEIIDDTLSLDYVKEVSQVRPHQCTVCLKRFKRRQHLKVHMNVHAKALGDNSVWCSMCHEGFLTNDEFEKHSCVVEDMNEQNAENVSQNNFEDIILDEAYSESLVNIPIHPEEGAASKPSPVRVFTCEECNKSFRRKDHYKIHLNIHTGVKSIFCPECNKGFYRKDHMQKHMLVHEKNKKKPPKREIPNLYPIGMINKIAHSLPEITIHAPPSMKLRLPLKMKVPYEVMSKQDNIEVISDNSQ